MVKPALALVLACFFLKEVLISMKNRFKLKIQYIAMRDPGFVLN
jgi:hypothetical protein